VVKEHKRYYGGTIKSVLCVMPNGLGWRDQGYRETPYTKRVGYTEDLIKLIGDYKDPLLEAVSNRQSKERIEQWLNWVASRKTELLKLMADEDHNSRHKSYSGVEVLVNKTIEDLHTGASLLIKKVVGGASSSWGGFEFRNVRLKYIGSNKAVKEINIDLRNNSNIGDVYYTALFKDEITQVLKQVEALQEEKLLKVKESFMNEMREDFTVLLVMDEM
jgi:hypothetical protein